MALGRGAVRTLLLASVLVVLLVTLAVAPAAAASNDLAGVVVNGTAGAKLPDGLTVHLAGLDASHNPLFPQTTQTDSTGHFVFSPATMPASATLAVSLDYAGASYETPVTRAADGTFQPVTLTVYEATTSDSAIQVAAANWVFEAVDTANQQITVLETLSIDNTGDRTYVGDHRGDPGSDAPGVLRRTIRLPLTNGASAFTPQFGLDPSAVLPVAGGFVDTEPILPGDHNVAYSYQIAYAEGGAEIRNALPYPTQKLRFFAPNADLELRSDNLKDAGTIAIQGRPYVILAGDNLAANTVVTVDVLGLPSTTTGRLDVGEMRASGFIAIGVALLVALFFGLRPKAARDDREAERARLIASLARLDDSFAAGRVAPEIYEAERAARKRALVDLILGDRASADVSGAP